MDNKLEFDTGDLTSLELEAAAGLLELNTDNSDKTQKQALLEIIEKKRQKGEPELTPDQLETYESIYKKLNESKMGGYKKTKKRRRKRKKKLRKKTRKRKRKTKKKRKIRKRKTKRRR